MSKSHRRRILVAFVPVAAASAQTRSPSPVFVEASILADHDATRFITTRTLAGAGATVGVFLTPPYSLRLDVEIPGWRVSFITRPQIGLRWRF